MRQIVLDTETTGLKPSDGHRVIEIGCIELIDRQLTGNHFHHYINPKRGVDQGAFRVHGISDQFLKDKKVFGEIVSEFMEFIDGAELIIHNAPFDVGFLNHELMLHGGEFGKVGDCCSVFDTLVLARKLHPGQKNNLDALCRRYEVDNSSRDLHGALLDAQILAQVYLSMTGGQESLFAEEGRENVTVQTAGAVKHAEIKDAEDLRVIKASEEELKTHESFFEGDS